MSSKKRLTLVVTLLLLLAVSIVTPAKAIHVIKGGSVAKTETIYDDTFIEAGVINMEGTIDGTLVANGNEVSITGKVNGDLIIVAKTARVSGDIDGNILFAGSRLTVSGKVRDNVYFAGASLSLNEAANIGRSVFGEGFEMITEADSHIGRGLFFQGTQVRLGGIIERSIDVSGETLEINGTVKGDVKLSLKTDPDMRDISLFFTEKSTKSDFTLMPMGIKVSEKAQVGGKFNYTSDENQNNRIHLPAEQIVFTKNQGLPQKPAFSLQLGSAPLAPWQDAIVILILGGLGLLLTPRFLEGSARKARRIVPAFFWGVASVVGGCVGLFVALIMIFVVGVLSAVVALFGLSFFVLSLGLTGWTLAGIFCLLMLMYGSKVVVGYAIGEWLLGLLKLSKPISRIWPMLIGVVIYIIIHRMPLAAAIILDLSMTVIGLGALWMQWRERIRTRRAQPAEAASVEC